MPRQNRGPLVGIHTKLCCSMHACITVSSHNSLWDFINMLSLRKLFLHVRSIIGASFVMVSWLRTYGTAAKLRASCECTHDSAAWRMSVSRSLVMIHYGITLMCYLPLIFPWNNFYVVCERHQATSVIFVGSKGHTTFICGLISLILVVTTHTSSLCILCVKVKPWSFLVLENNWLAPKMEICFSAAEMQEFVHSLS
jgi:hypothetical protein